MKYNCLREFLNFFWLRPENAIALAIRADKYRQTMDRYLTDPGASMDVSCGDGVFSFISGGGGLSAKTDMFRGLNLDYQTREGNFDVFDAFDPTYVVDITKRPEYTYQYGTDWKGNLLKKADMLGIYNNLFQHDNNQPLPLQSDTLDFVYSNSAYWVANIESHLRDLVRVLRPGGTLALEFKTSKIMDYKSDSYAPFMGETFHKRIDGGRLSSWRGLRSFDEIRQLLSGIQGTTVDVIEPVYGNVLGQLWDVGMRPLFKPLVKLANNAPSDVRLEAKEEWCDTFNELFGEFLEGYTTSIDEAFEFLFVLRKNE